MSLTISGSDHRSWEAYGLKDYGDFADMTTDYYVRDDGCDVTAGSWYYIDDMPHVVPEQGTFRVIYGGGWDNYNSPGASHHTYAELYDVDDESDMIYFAEQVSDLEAAPEYRDDPDDGEDEVDDDEPDRADDAVNLDGFVSPEELTPYLTHPVLGGYARAKQEAMRARLAGQINIALAAEKVADQIYDGLPSKYQW